jgi:hypothetical protein
MGLTTYSDPGAMAHAGQALAAGQAFEQEAENLALTRARTDAVRMQGEADLLRTKMAQRAEQERAARNLGVAVDELSRLGVNPRTINLADDFAWVAERAPDLAQQALGLFPDPGQESEAAVYMAKMRRQIEQQEAQGEKRELFEDFMLRNGPMLATEGGGPDGQQAEHPVVTNLRGMLDDEQLDAVSFRVAVEGAATGLAKQTQKRLTLENNIAKAQQLYSQGIGTVTSRKDRERATEIMADLMHNPGAKSGALLVELGALMNGQGEDFYQAMEESAREGAAAVRALLERGEANAAAQRGPMMQQTSARGGAVSAPEQSAPALEMPKQPAASPEEAKAAVRKFVEVSRSTGRQVVHVPTLLEYTSRLLGRPATKDDVRALLRDDEMKVGGALPSDQQQILIERLTVSGKAKTTAAAEAMIEKMSPEERKQALGRFGK